MIGLRCDLIVGARPNFMKAAPVAAQLRCAPARFAVRVIHTGQHYDAALSDLLFSQLGMPVPDLNLGVGSGTQAAQTARIMTSLEQGFVAETPDLVLVFGDVNSTLAAALVAAKLRIAVGHVEAGLRSFDRAMPEEINRVVVDTLSDLLFTTEAAGNENLRREGVPPEIVHFVGNTMIDTLVKHRASARALDIAGTLGLRQRGYVVVTLHRPSNVDDEAQLTRIAAALLKLGDAWPIVFPVHPRTASRLRAAGHWDVLAAHNVTLRDPLGYLEFLGLMDSASAILTDSGGIQEESVALGVPCVTLRTTTERPVTVETEGNVLVGDDPSAAVAAVIRAAAGVRKEIVTPPLWDGHAAERIAGVIDEWDRRGRPRRYLAPGSVAAIR
jgi:UDP-N-acetylglucosamine 2-epimerase (non-hydrolysing)